MRIAGNCPFDIDGSAKVLLAVEKKYKEIFKDLFYIIKK